MSVKKVVKLKQLRENAKMPFYGSEMAAGADICACGESIVLGPGDRWVVPTGLAIELPVGYEAQIRPRSGLAAKKGLTVLNAPGTIDADYRGEIGVILINLGDEPVVIEDGDRIAQMVIAEAPQVKFLWAESMSETERGENGYGSTGVSS